MTCFALKPDLRVLLAVPERDKVHVDTVCLGGNVIILLELVLRCLRGALRELSHVMDEVTCFMSVMSLLSSPALTPPSYKKDSYVFNLHAV